MATTLIEGVGIVNQSLRDLGYEYQIDTTSNDTMTAGLEAIGAYAPSQRNAIMEQMNLILQQRNYGVMFDATKNKFRAFLVGLEENGFGIEDLFHELIDGVKPLWDGNATAQEIAQNLVEYKGAKVHKFFHTSPMEKMFDCTVDVRNYKKVFTAYGVTRYIDTKLANLSWSAEVWLQNQVVGVVKQMISDGKIVKRDGLNPNTETGVTNIAEDINATLSGFLTPCKLYNYGVYDETVSAWRSVVNMSNSMDDIFIITTPEVFQRVKTHGYSNAFNLSEFELQGRIMYAPAGTDLGTINGEKVLFVALDRRAILAGLRRWDATSFFVANTGWMNHFLNVEGIKGYNTVFNAVAFTGEAIDTYTESAYNTIVHDDSDGSGTTVITDGILVGNNASGGKIYRNASYIDINNETESVPVVVNLNANGNTYYCCTEGNNHIELVDGKEYYIQLN